MFHVYIPPDQLTCCVQYCAKIYTMGSIFVTADSDATINGPFRADLRRPVPRDDMSHNMRF